MRVLLIQGHPNPGAYNRALADAYVRGVERAGVDVERLDLSELAFDPILRHGYARIQPLEPSLLAAQQAILRADHLVLAYPVWWGAPPALLKGFFDRTFLPGWAFRFRGAWPLPEGLLRGRSAHVITTMDAPRAVYAALYRGSAHRSVIQGVLRFCGIGPVTSTTIGAVKYLPEWLRSYHLQRMERLGFRHAVHRAARK